MRRFIHEEFQFTITVVDGKTNADQVIDCRNGHELGDCYTCAYGCPQDFCAKSMLKAFPLMEAVRAGGDLRLLGGDSPHSITFSCPDGVVHFRLDATEI